MRIRQVLPNSSYLDFLLAPRVQDGVEPETQRHEEPDEGLQEKSEKTQVAEESQENTSTPSESAVNQETSAENVELTES